MKVRFGAHDTVIGTPSVLDARLDALIDQINAHRAVIAHAEAGIARCLAHAAQLADDRAAATPSTITTPSEARANERRLVTIEIATATRQSERTVAARLGDAEQLVHDFPTTLTALETGQVSALHARHLITHAATVPADARRGFETRLLEIAATETPYRFEDRARRMRETAHPESITARHQQAHDKRSVFVTPECDGMATLIAHLTAPDAIAIDDLLDKIARTERTTTAGTTATCTDPSACTATGTCACTDTSGCAATGTARDPEPGTSADASAGAGAGAGADLRTHIQRRADAFTRLLLTPDNPARPPSITANVLITVPATTIAGADTPGNLHGYGPIDPDTARHIAATAPTFLRVLTHPITREPTMVTRHWGRAVADHLRPPTPKKSHATTDPLPADNHYSATSDHRAADNHYSATSDHRAADNHYSATSDHRAADNRTTTSDHRAADNNPAIVAGDPHARGDGGRDSDQRGGDERNGDGQERASDGRERYSAAPDLRLVLATIDETCRFPHCGRRANRCELDHTHDWAHNGPTTPDNLTYLCTRHHHLKHDTAWTVQPDPDHPRHLNWTSPHGRKYTTKPPPPPDG